MACGLEGFTTLSRAFLTAEWRHLAMLNFVADPKLLEPFVPAGTELDFHESETFVSVVGFMFLQTRVIGLPIPFHRNFEEVNLRLYVRKQSPEGWRRGVVFVRELVPRRAIAFVARAFYDEPYLAVPMRHSIAQGPEGLAVQYQWWRGGLWETLGMKAAGGLHDSGPGSHEEFITEHYWGYTKRPGATSEYQVEHPRWRVWPATSWNLDVDVAGLYGAAFVETLNATPASAFIAEGSVVTVRRRTRDPNLEGKLLASLVSNFEMGEASSFPYSRSISQRARDSAYFRVINSRSTNGRIPPCR